MLTGSNKSNFPHHIASDMLIIDKHYLQHCTRGFSCPSALLYISLASTCHVQTTSTCHVQTSIDKIPNLKPKNSNVKIYIKLVCTYMHMYMRWLKPNRLHILLLDGTGLNTRVDGVVHDGLTTLVFPKSHNVTEKDDTQVERFDLLRKVRL